MAGELIFQGDISEIMWMLRCLILKKFWISPNYCHPAPAPPGLAPCTWPWVWSVKKRIMEWRWWSLWSDDLWYDEYHMMMCSGMQRTRVFRMDHQLGKILGMGEQEMLLLGKRMKSLWSVKIVVNFYVDNTSYLWWGSWGWFWDYRWSSWSWSLLLSIAPSNIAGCHHSNKLKQPSLVVFYFKKFTKKL